MKRNTLQITLAAIVFSLMATSVLAQSSTGQKKLYRWVDPQGNVHYVDTLPKEAIPEARKELTRGGTVVNQVDAAKTPEQLAEEAAQAALLQQEDAIRKERERLDRILLAYPGVEDLRRPFQERISGLQAQEGTLIRQQENLEAAILEYINNMSELELAGTVFDESDAANWKKYLDQRKAMALARQKVQQSIAEIEEEMKAQETRYQALSSGQVSLGDPESTN